MRWWESERGRQRLAIEKAMMEQTYPGQAKLILDREANKLYWLVTFNVEGGPHVVKVVYPDWDYPSEAPKAYVIEPHIRSSKHQYSSGELCLFNPDKGRRHGWDPGCSTAVTIAAWARDWLKAYYTYKRWHFWPGDQD